MITLKEITELQRREMRTLSSKIIYLMIKNRTSDKDWAEISASEFGAATSLTTRAVYHAIRKLESCGLIEQRKEKERPNSTNQYRIIEP